MLSVLIPVFNFDVGSLVEELAMQCANTGVLWEILCLDDGSSSPYRVKNRQIKRLAGIRYEELPENIGRAAIRNRLAEMASFPYLLFMDCDSKVVRADYIARYMAQLNPEIVLYGGRVYAPVPPEDSRYLLHWTFGTAREQISPELRTAQPYHSFMTNNFLIPKNIFLSIGFDERLREYGHEDTLFGMELQRRGIPVLHLDNPLAHIGLEPAEVFLQKTDQAVRNLIWLYHQGIPIQTRLLSAVIALKKYRVSVLAGWMLKAAAPLLKKNLRSKRPDMMALDGYKLYRALEKRT